jgi:hypothetical protein
MKTMSRTGALLAVVIVGLAAFFLLNDAPDVHHPDADGVVELTMSGYAFEPGWVAVPSAEPVTITIVNDNPYPQDLTFGRTVVEQDRSAVAFGDDLFAGLEPVVHPATAIVAPTPPAEGLTVRVPASGSVSIDVTIPQTHVGTWQIGCFSAHGCHYRAGLAAELRVE